MLKDTIIFTFNDIKKEGVEKQQTTPPQKQKQTIRNSNWPQQVTLISLH